MFSKTRIVIYLRPTAIELYDAKTVEVQKLSLKKDVYEDGLIRNHEKFKELLIEFIAKLSIVPQTAIILLAGGVFFQKVFPLEEKSEEKLQKFFIDVPIPTGQIAKRTIQTTSHLYALATNKELYELVTYIFQEQGWSIQAVVPATLFVEGEDSSTLSQEQITHIVSDSKRLQKCNFLETNGKSSTDKILSMRVIAMVVAIVVLMCAGLFIMQFISSEKKEKAVVTPVVTTPTVTPIPAISKKEEVTITIKNGTGIPGQAGKVKRLLEGMKFSEITTENADSTTAEVTTVTYRRKVSDAIKEELQEELASLFETVEVKENIGDGSIVEILTGPYK